MSGSQIGSAVGFVAGFFLPGGPQVWMTIGGIAGGAIDPEVIQGPRIRDAQTQTSNDGVPRPIVYGVAAIAGNVIARGELVHRNVTTEQSKGGPEVKEDHVYLTYAIRICEGPIAGIRRIWRDDKLVYDISNLAQRPEIDTSDAISAISYKARANAFSQTFQSKATFYLGGETQLPDPSLEAIFGVGETPAYRGTAYMVVTDDDLTERRGTIPQYRFEVVSSGTDETTVTTETVVAPLSRFRNAHWPLVDNVTDYTYTGYRLTGSGDIADTFSADTISAVQAHFAPWYDGIYVEPSFYLGYSASTANDLGSFGYSGVVEQSDVTDNASLVLVYNQQKPEYFVSAAADDFCPLVPYPGANGVSKLYADETGIVCYKEADSNPSAVAGTTLFNHCNDDPDNGGYQPSIAGWYPLYIKVERKAVTPAIGEPGDPCELKKRVLMPDTGDAMIDCDGQISAAAEYEETAGDFLQLAAAIIDTGTNPHQYTQYPVGPVLTTTDPNAFVQAYWEAEYADAVTAGTMLAGLTYGVDYPVEVSTALTETLTERTLTADMASLPAIVLDVADRVSVAASKLDVTDLAGMEVRGYVLGRQMEASAALRGLQLPYLFDMPEWDGKVRCVLRGGAIKATITDDDLIDREEDEDTRAQSLEFPRKLHVAYPDPAKAYAVTKQTSERRSSQVKAESESGIELALSLFADEAATIVHRQHKIAWADAEGGAKFALPEEFSYLTPSDCIERNGKRLRIDSVETLDGEQVYDTRVDRISAYTGDATGAEAPLPTGPAANLRGPTRLEFLNVPPLRDSDDRIGYTVAVCGILDTWQGCLLQEESVTGEFVTRAVISDASVMGFTTTDLPDAQPWTYYPDATLTVQVHGGEPTAATFEQVLREANGFAIGNSDVWEICQFTGVTDNGSGSFTLTGLTRGRLDTTPEPWPADSRFVLLNAPTFIETTAAQIGTTLTLRPVSNGTVPANNYTEGHDFTVCNAQKEWAPILLETTRDASNNITLSWVGRGRLGTNANAFHGQYFDGYRVTLQKDAAIKHYYTTDSTLAYSAAQQTADFGSATGTLTVSIYAMNRITGASEPLRGTA